MKIGTTHRNKIWKSLLDWRKSVNTVDLSQIQPSLTAASDISLSSQTSAYNPGYYEITRYTFKQVISVTNESIELGMKERDVKNGVNGQSKDAANGQSENGVNGRMENGVSNGESEMEVSPTKVEVSPDSRKRKSECLDE